MLHSPSAAVAAVAVVVVVGGRDSPLTLCSPQQPLSSSLPHSGHTAVVAVASAPSPVAPVVVGTVAPPAVVVDTGIVPADSVPQMFHSVGCC